MDNQNLHQEFKLSTDKSLLVAGFLAVIMFAVLFTVVQIINRGEQYSQTSSRAEEAVITQESITDTEELKRETEAFQNELDSVYDTYSEPELDINLELQE